MAVAHAASEGCSQISQVDRSLKTQRVCNWARGIMVSGLLLGPWAGMSKDLRPKTKKEMRQFLGLAGSYRRFVPNQTSPAQTDLTKKEAL